MQSAGPASKEIAGESADDPQREEKPEQVGPGTKPLDEKGVQATDAAPSDPTSVNEGVLPHATDKDEGRGKANTTDSGAKEQTPLDGTKTDRPPENKDTAKKASNPEDLTLEKSWEVIMKEVTALDEGLVGGWKEDIDTLLVFAGLFSAVVTAFTIESYQWLQEAPEDTTVALLKQISQQINGSSISQSGPDEFTVSSSVVAINALWFLSLILALVDALFALLCKQWLRENRRHTHTPTPSEALALRWLRNQSLEKWQVPTILASLPMLLESALFLFLAGLLELLRTRHPVLFKLATIVVAFATLFYFGTTVIPTVNIIRQARQVTQKLDYTRKYPNNSSSPVDFIMTLPPMEYTCPYKSPQAWTTFQVLRFISRIPSLLLHCVRLFVTKRRLRLRRRDYIATRSILNKFSEYLNPTRQEIIGNLSNWSSVDLELLQRSSVNLAPPFYELDAFRWLVAELRDSPHMIPHLRNILSTIPLHLVMPAVLDQWFFLPERKWAVRDIEAALDSNLTYKGIEGHLTFAKRRCLDHGRRMGYFNRLLHWTNVSMNGGNDHDSGRDSPPPFLTPFETIDANPDNDLRDRLWDIYTEILQGPARPKYYRETLMEDLAPYIIASSLDYTLHLPTTTTTSSFVKSTVGRDFLSNVHNIILERALYKDTEVNNRLNWTEAMDIVQRVHNFPEDHFRVIPGHFSLSLSKLRKTLDNLSPADPEVNFGYLDSFRRGWDNAHLWIKVEFVNIISEHINHYPQSDAESSHCPDLSKISPLVMSSAGLKLITFVNDHLAKEWDIWDGLRNNGRTGWRDAIERARAAHSELSPDHFKHIFHGLRDDPPAPAQRSSRQEAKVGAQAEVSGGSPRGVTDTGDVDRDEQMEGPSNPKPSLQPKPGELDEQGPLVEDAERGSIPRQPVPTGDPASGSASGSVQGNVVGGPDADENV
ncbi:hypothetical protein PQX77_017627 [Marasmius sp. AFHP31]|nr:hypothetical protein PQX77_017627 [Marasmius sp. AFHP31]